MCLDSTKNPKGYLVTLASPFKFFFPKSQSLCFRHISPTAFSMSGISIGVNSQASLDSSQVLGKSWSRDIFDLE